MGNGGRGYRWKRIQVEEDKGDGGCGVKNIIFKKMKRFTKT